MSEEVCGLERRVQPFEAEDPVAYNGTCHLKKGHREPHSMRVYVRWWTK